MKIKVTEWQVEIPSGQCPFTEFPYNYSQNKTGMICNIKRAQELPEVFCEEETCPLKTEKLKHFTGFFMQGGE